jgi:dTDP-4-amino-4,6-dideoxygalactose transaminase
MLPVTEEVSQRVITLPLHPLMKVTDAKWIAEKVKEVIKEIT